jgi:hypothetical protein
MTRIPCANSTGSVLVEPNPSGVDLTWLINDEDGLGEPVFHLGVPAALARDLGTNLHLLVIALAEQGLGFQVDGPRDLQQTTIRAKRYDAEGWQ